jgi:hypothetical protein
MRWKSYQANWWEEVATIGMVVDEKLNASAEINEIGIVKSRAGPDLLSYGQIHFGHGSLAPARLAYRPFSVDN